MADKHKKKAFVASEELTEKITRIQHELGLASPGEVINMGISLVELALGREVEFHDKNKIYKTNKFSKYNQTVILDGTSDESDN